MVRFAGLPEGSVMWPPVRTMWPVPLMTPCESEPLTVTVSEPGIVSVPAWKLLVQIDRLRPVGSVTVWPRASNRPVTRTSPPLLAIPLNEDGDRKPLSSRVAWSMLTVLALVQRPASDTRAPLLMLMGEVMEYSPPLRIRTLPAPEAETLPVSCAYAISSVPPLIAWTAPWLFRKE